MCSLGVVFPGAVVDQFRVEAFLKSTLGKGKMICLIIRQQRTFLAACVSIRKSGLQFCQEEVNESMYMCLVKSEEGRGNGHYIA